MPKEMKRWHVHVYETPKLAEIELSAETEEQAMLAALDQVKRGQVICDQESPTAHLALAFEKEDG